MARIRSIQIEDDYLVQDYYERFIEFKKSQQLAPRTLKDYETLKGIYKGCEVKDFKNHTIKYLAGLNGKVGPVTYNTRLKYIKTFYLWMMREKILPKDTDLELTRIKEDTKPKAVKPEDVLELLKCCNQKDWAGFRDYCMIKFQLNTGIRPSEARLLKVKDFNFEDKLVVIPAEIAKDRESRSIPVSSDVFHDLKKLIKHRAPEWGKVEEGIIFCTCSGLPLNRSSWARRLRKYSKMCGKKISPYVIRHTYATYFLRSGGDSLYLKEILGHSTLMMTRRYTDIHVEDLRATMENHDPLTVNSTTRKGKLTKGDI